MTRNILFKFLLPRIRPYVQDIVGGHQWESGKCSNIFINYFRNKEIKHESISIYIYITRVSACKIHINNIYQTNKLNPFSTVNLKSLFILPLVKAGKSTEKLSGDTERW